MLIARLNISIEHIDGTINDGPEQHATSLKMCNNKLIDIIGLECGG